MTYQRILLRALSSRPLRHIAIARDLLRNRAWVIENGAGAGLKLRLPQNTEYISGLSEVPVQKELARRLKPGDVVYDIGANMGFFSLISARIVGPGGQVYSFEPVAENAASIRENARLNDFSNVTLFDVAVGANSGHAELLLTDWDGGSSLSTSSVKPSEPVSKRTVQVVTLDDIIEQERLRPPNFVKIDVEGVELDVLRGMSKTIDKAKPLLLYEVDDGNKDSFERRWRDLDAYVTGFGYEISHLETSYSNVGWNVGHSLAIPREMRRAN